MIVSAPKSNYQMSFKVVVQKNIEFGALTNKWEDLSKESAKDMPKNAAFNDLARDHLYNVSI